MTDVIQLKKSGRTTIPRMQVTTTKKTPIQQFLDEYFDIDPNGKTREAHVVALHRFWRGSRVCNDETSVMIAFFKERFQAVQEMDPERDMTCSFYKGLTMKPWQPNVADIEDIDIQEDINVFIQETCDVAIMGRASSDGIWEAFIAWKTLRQTTKYKVVSSERTRFFTYMNAMFVYYKSVKASSTDDVGLPGFYGLYMKNASKEDRKLGYDFSSDTRTTVLKFDATGAIVNSIVTQNVFARNVVGKSTTYAGTQLTKWFKDGMQAFSPGDGFTYMRATDYAIKVASGN